MESSYQQAQELQKGLQQMQQQLQLLLQQDMELEQLIDALKELQKHPEKKELLVPFGAGISLKAELTDSKKVILNVGANITVEKNIDDTLLLIEKQKKELKIIEQSMQEEFAHVQQQLQFLQISQMQHKE